MIDDIKYWCEFGEHRCYILMAIARRKFNEELTHGSEIVYRRVISSYDEVERNVNDIMSFINGHDYHFRVYLSVNARDTLKAFFEFQKTMLNLNYAIAYGDKTHMKKLTRLDSEWKSVLHQPQSRADSYFLFDVDGVSDISEFEASVEDKLMMTISTPNGYHVITKPFNYTVWEPPIEYDALDTDGQMFIKEIP